MAEKIDGRKTIKFCAVALKAIAKEVAPKVDTISVGKAPAIATESNVIIPLPL